MEYNQALKARGVLAAWFEPDMQWQQPASGKQGRRQSHSVLPDPKALFNLALRQTVVWVESLIKLSGLPWKTADFSTVCRRQRRLDEPVHYTPSKVGLHLLVESSA